MSSSLPMKSYLVILVYARMTRKDVIGKSCEESIQLLNQQVVSIHFVIFM